MDKLEQMLNELFTKQVRVKYSSGSDYYDVYVVREESRVLVEQIIRNYLLEYRDEKIGVLEAKVFMYEQIISKSNFAPMLAVDATKVEGGDV